MSKDSNVVPNVLGSNIKINTGSTTHLLNSMEVKKINSQTNLINANGCVTSIAWNINNPPSLYLAISTSQENKNLINKKRKENGVVQIWRIQQEHIGNKSSIEKIEYAGGITHCFSFAWDMEWIVPEFSDSNEKNCQLLVSAADGKIYIYALPNLDKIHGNIDILPIASMEFRDSLCFKICCSRFRINDRQLLLASSTSGDLGIWDLDFSEREPAQKITQIRVFSQDLKTEIPENKKSRFFSRQWQGHKFSTAVRCLRWHTSDPNIFFSGGDDFLLKIWDIRKTQHPLFEYNFSLGILNLCFTNLSNTVLVTLEDSDFFRDVYLFNFETLSRKVLPSCYLLDKSKETMYAMDVVISNQHTNNEKTNIVYGNTQGLLYMHVLSKNFFEDAVSSEHTIQILCRMSSNKKKGQINISGPYNKFKRIKKMRSRKKKSYESRLNTLITNQNEDELKTDSINIVKICNVSNNLVLAFASTNGVVSIMNCDQ